MTPRPSNPVHSRPAGGFVVVLALVAVSVATVVGLSIATTRDANVATSSNLSLVANARAAAASGIDIARSMLAKEGSLARLQDGVLFDGVVVNGAKVRVEVRDIQSGRPATEESIGIEVIARGEHDGCVQIARAIGRTPAHDTPLRADLDCSEFAVLATESLSVDSGAHIGPWTKSPLAVLAEPIRFGHASGSAAGVNISESATTHGCVRLSNGRFAGNTEQADEALASGLCPVPAPIHVPDAPHPAMPDGIEAVPALLVDGLVSSSAASSGDARVPSRGSATLRGTLRLDIAGNFFCERGSRMFVENNAVIVVRGNTVVDAATIEVANGGSLTLVALGDLTVDGSYLGGARSNAEEGRELSGEAAYDGGATRTVVFGSEGKRVLIAGGSVVKGQVYAPKSRVDVESRSAVYGRILGKQVMLHEGVALFYDHVLDARRGWTTAESGIWTSSGTVNEQVKSVEKLDDASLLKFAADTGLEPDPPSAADAGVVLALEGFQDRIEQISNDDAKQLRRAIKARLAERVAELKRVHELKLYEREGESKFLELGFEGELKEND